MVEEARPPDGGSESGGGGPLRAFVGLFLVPLLVVLICVGVFVGFGWIAYERHSTRDYLHDLHSGWRPRRAQAAYELSKVLLADPHALDDEPGVKTEVRDLFTAAEDEGMKRYLALVLGYTRDPEAVPLLIEALEDASSELRIYALWALGSTGDPRARGPLVDALDDADPGIRKTAAFGLGELAEVGVISALLPLLEDPFPDVRWNAAVALTRLGSGAGVPVLYRMLDRGLTAQIPGITAGQTEEAMVSAVRALVAVRHPEAAAVLERLAAEDPSLKVRQAAMEGLEAL